MRKLLTLFSHFIHCTFTFFAVLQIITCLWQTEQRIWSIANYLVMFRPLSRQLSRLAGWLRFIASRPSATKIAV